MFITAFMGDVRQSIEVTANGIILVQVPFQKLQKHKVYFQWLYLLD